MQLARQHQTYWSELINQTARQLSSRKNKRHQNSVHITADKPKLKNNSQVQITADRPNFMNSSQVQITADRPKLKNPSQKQITADRSKVKNPSEMDQLVKWISWQKASGVDLRKDFLKHLGSAGKKYLSKIFSQSWHTHIGRFACKDAYIQSILKPWKDKKRPKNCSTTDAQSSQFFNFCNVKTSGVYLMKTSRTAT